MKWRLVTKNYDNTKPDYIRSEISPHKVCDFNGIQNRPTKFSRAREIVDIHNHLAENLDRMSYLSAVIREELSYGDHGSMAAELDSYIEELSELTQIEN